MYKLSELHGEVVPAQSKLHQVMLSISKSIVQICSAHYYLPISLLGILEELDKHGGMFHTTKHAIHKPLFNTCYHSSHWLSCMRGTLEAKTNRRILPSIFVTVMGLRLENSLSIYIWNFYLKINFKIQTCLFTLHDSLQANLFEYIPTFIKTPHHSLVVTASHKWGSLCA